MVDLGIAPGHCRWYSVLRNVWRCHEVAAFDRSVASSDTSWWNAAVRSPDDRGVTSPSLRVAFLEEGALGLVDGKQFFD